MTTLDALINVSIYDIAFHVYEPAMKILTVIW